MRAELERSRGGGANFDGVVTPVAKTQLDVVFYDFADTLCELLAKEVAEWRKSTAIGVKHVCVDGDVATQQLIAEKQAGERHRPGPGPRATRRAAGLGP